MLEAVLFDWGDTLGQFVWDDRLLDEGHAAGLRALGLAPDARLTDRFRSEYLPLLERGAEPEELDYPALVRRLLADFGLDPSGEELDAFLAAEHDAWAPAIRLGPDSLELLDVLRARGLRLGLVSNVFDPGPLVRQDLARMGVLERLDVVVLSGEVGRRKPHPELFERALAGLDVAAGDALFVGDALYDDIRGAGEAGLTTVQALWFRVDDDPRGWEPDYRATAALDVLEIADTVSTA